MEKQLEKYQPHFQSWTDLNVGVVTWNCAGNVPTANFDITNILTPDKDSHVLPDLYIVGLQEMVKLNAKSVIKGKDVERVMLWEQIIARTLCKKTKYVCISKKAMVGCYILFFAKDEKKNLIN